MRAASATIMTITAAICTASAIAASLGPAQSRVVETRGIWSLEEVGLANGGATCLIEGIPLQTDLGKFIFSLVPRIGSPTTFGGTTGFVIQRIGDRSVTVFVPMTRGSVQIDGHPFPTTLVEDGDQLRLDGDVNLITKAHSLVVTYGFRDTQERTVSYDLAGLPDLYERFKTDCHY